MSFSLLVYTCSFIIPHACYTASLGTVYHPLCHHPIPSFATAWSTDDHCYSSSKYVWLNVIESVVPGTWHTTDDYTLRCASVQWGRHSKRLLTFFHPATRMLSNITHTAGKHMDIADPSRVNSSTIIQTVYNGRILMCVLKGNATWNEMENGTSKSKMENAQSKMLDGKWEKQNGKCKTRNGKWESKNAKRKMGNV